MQMKKSLNISPVWCKACIMLLALCWIFGLVVGGSYATLTGSSFSSLMRAVPGCGVSIIGLLGVTALPFLFTAIAAYFDRPFLLFPIAFTKAFLWSCTCCWTVISFGGSGWLVRFLLLFTDSVSLPFLFYLWLQELKGTPGDYWLKFSSCCSIVAVIAVVDYLMVSPFLALLIK